jgi:aspartyl protease family protein
MRLVYLISILALVSAGFIFGQRFRTGEVVRNLAIWSLIVGVLVLGFTFQSELGYVFGRVRSEFAPGYGVTTDPNTLALSESGGGHFLVIGQVNGEPVEFLVDTGASDVVLSPADARRIGIDLAGLNYTRVYSSANGMVRGAPYTVETLAIGPIALRNVPVSVNQAEMDVSLLGMTFLSRLDSYEVRGRQLLLRYSGG